MSALDLCEVFPNCGDRNAHADLTCVFVFYASGGLFFFLFRGLPISGGFFGVGAKPFSSEGVLYIPKRLWSPPDRAPPRGRTSFTLACLSSLILVNFPAASGVRGFSWRLTM